MPIIDFATEVDIDLNETTPKIPVDDKQTREFLDKIWEVYGGYSGLQLSEKMPRAWISVGQNVEGNRRPEECKYRRRHYPRVLPGTSSKEPFPCLNMLTLSIPSFNYQMTPKISLNTRCSISISENLSINGQTRSSDQLGIWSYNINP